MVRQSVRTLFRPSGGPSHCPSVSSFIHPFIHPFIQTSEQLIKNNESKPLEYNTDFTAIVIIDNWQLLN